MANEDFVLSREQRDDIMKAVAAITRQLKVMVGQPQPHTPSLWVIGTNLTAIHASLANLRSPAEAVV
jgi:hypothetical protein